MKMLRIEKRKQKSKYTEEITDLEITNEIEGMDGWVYY